MTWVTTPAWMEAEDAYDLTLWKIMKIMSREEAVNQLKIKFRK